MSYGVNTDFVGVVFEDQCSVKEYYGIMFSFWLEERVQQHREVLIFT
jgi:hypothetical protein